MKKIISMVILMANLLVLFNVVSAQYKSGSLESNVPNATLRYADASHNYEDYGRVIYIGLTKLDYVIDWTDTYAYRFTFFQFVSQKPFSIKSVTLTSEFDSMTINRNSAEFKRENGLSVVTDYIDYSYDPGRINRIILGSINTLRIRIVTNDNRTYDYYPDKEHLDELKQVANWS